MLYRGDNRIQDCSTKNRRVFGLGSSFGEPHPSEPEKAQIAVQGADELYREIRIENALEDESGKQVKLKAGAQVNVTVETDPKDTNSSIK